MAAGHRAAQVVGAPESVLLELVGGAPVRPVEPPRDHISAWVEAARRLDGEALDAGFRKELSLLGAERFATERVLPFLRALGDAWISGKLEIFQEHYASNRLRDLLSRTTRDLADVARGAAVVLAALPADRHALALHVAALFAAVHGWRPAFLGPDTPMADIVRAVAQSRAEAIVISVTDGGDGGVPSALRVDQVRALRAALPPDVELLMGGSGAPVHLAGVRFLPHLSALADWAARRTD